MPNLWWSGSEKPPRNSPNTPKNRRAPKIEPLKEAKVNAWTSQYNMPTAKALIAQLDPEARPLYESFRTALSKQLSTKPKLKWTGLSWKWCEAIELDAGGMLIAVHLVPDPTNIRIAVTLSSSFFQANAPSDLPRHLHSGLSTATSIGHQSWCEWALGSQEAHDSILELIERTQGS